MAINPKISIIIPIYNVEKYLRQCLNSVISQTLKDIEIILVVGESSDNSAKIAQEYALKDKRTKIIIQKEKGLGDARNIGMAIANGEYIGFIDSDDWIDLDFYEKLYNKALADDADIVQSFIQFYFEDDNRMRAHVLNHLIENCPIQLEVYNTAGMCWNKIYKHELIQKYDLKFPPESFWEDNPFVIRSAYFANRVSCMKDVSYYYRQRTSSLMQLENKKIYFDLLDIHEDIVRFLNSIIVEPDVYVIMFNHIMYRIRFDGLNKLKENESLKRYEKEYFEGIIKIYKLCKYKELFYKKYYNEFLDQLEGRKFSVYRVCHNFKKNVNTLANPTQIRKNFRRLKMFFN